MFGAVRSGLSERVSACRRAACPIRGCPICVAVLFAAAHERPRAEHVPIQHSNSENGTEARDQCGIIGSVSQASKYAIECTQISSEPGLGIPLTALSGILSQFTGSLAVAVMHIQSRS